MPATINTPLVAIVSVLPAAIEPLVQLSCPLTVSSPAPDKLPPLKDRTPFAFTILALFSVRVLPAVVSVCVPLTPPKVRLPTVGLVFSVTV